MQGLCESKVSTRYLDRHYPSYEFLHDEKATFELATMPATHQPHFRVWCCLFASQEPRRANQPNFLPSQRHHQRLHSLQ